MPESSDPSRSQPYWDYADDAYSIYSHNPALYAEHNAYHLDHWVSAEGWSLSLPRTPANDAHVQAIVDALVRIGNSAEGKEGHPDD